MSSLWDEIDPVWAWSPYQPSEDMPWNLARVAHLFRRAGFGASTTELKQAVEQSPHEVLAQLISLPPAGDPFERESEELAQSLLATGDPRQLAAWWVHRMLYTPSPLVEKMTLFWHGHFATSAEKVNDAELMYQQNRLLRSHALGDFSQLAQAISKDAAMLLYLDSATNRKAHPNENYARELMELFCLGEGNYTEQDVQQAARCFTGWEIRRKQFRFNSYQFDNGEKLLFGKRGPFTGEQAVELVLDRPEMPRFIVRKLFRFFVADEPPPPDTLLEPLARQFREMGLNVGQLLHRMLGSQLFFSPYAMARKIRSPVDFSVGLLRSLDGAANVRMVAQECAKMGQALFYPPNVKGWDGGRAWINSATLLARANCVRAILKDSNTRFGGGGLLDLARRYGADQPPAFVAWLANLLLAVPLSASVESDLIELARRGSTEENLRDVLYAAGTLAEFQLM